MLSGKELVDVILWI